MRRVDRDLGAFLVVAAVVEVVMVVNAFLVSFSLDTGREDGRDKTGKAQAVSIVPYHE